MGIRGLYGRGSVDSGLEIRLELTLQGNCRIWMWGCVGKMATAGRFTLGKGKGERAYVRSREKIILA